MKSAQVFPLRIPVLLLGVLLLLAAFLATGALSVRAGGVLHVPADFATIQEAVDASGPGDKIKVAAGTYNEQVLIDGRSHIRLQGQDAVLQGSNTGIGIKIVDSDHIQVQGFIVEKYRTGIVLEGTDHSQIQNVETRFNDNVADTVGGVPNALNNNGLDLIGSSHNLITNVFAHHNGHNGITLKGGSTHNTLRGNTSNDNGINPDILTRPAGCGIQLSRDGNHKNIIMDNETNRNAFGILLSGRSPSQSNPEGADDNKIMGNISSDNARSGIDIRDKSSGNIIVKNVATGNGGGGGPNVDLNDQAGVGEDPTDPAVLDNIWKNNQGETNF